MSKFVREGRYIVFKISHLDKEQLELLERVQRELPTLRDCVVVESDWPEYEKVWKMIEGRVNEKGSETKKPDTQLWESSYAYDWIIWCGWRIRQEEFTDVRSALRKLMQETKGTVHPTWFSGWFCPACEGTKVFNGEPCLNCDGKGIFDEYMNEPLVKPKRNKVELELDWQDVRKAAEGGNKAFDKWLEEKGMNMSQQPTKYERRSFVYKQS